jgi:aspartyl-tRNA(Asn)/glutamyl-tRNA(Gln) amidotransferase subunit A
MNPAATPSDITGFDLVGLAETIAARKISSLEATTALLARIRALAPKLNCFIALDEEKALAQARSADDDQAGGRLRGPLHGVPLAHKDMYYRAGRVSTCGSQIRRTFTPRHTATVLQRLDAAGALDIGTLNMAEFAFNPTGHNAHFGHCRNPWNTAHVTGGSSSGSGSAVAARLAFAALGSDTGGSIRIPAAICGTSGIKPTQTRVSRHGVMPLSHSLDNVGPLTISVRDAARVLGVIAGPDGRDPTASSIAVPDYEKGLALGVKGLRIGVVRGYFYEGSPPDVVEAMEASIGVYRALGAEIVDVEMPDARLYATYAAIVSRVEAASIHGPWLHTRAEDYGVPTRNRLLAGLALPATRYHDALSRRGPLLQQVLDSAFSKADVLHVPGVAVPSPTIAASDETKVDCGALTGLLSRNTRVFNYLGLPGLSAPCGFAGNGTPVGFQLIGKPFAEARLFRVGHAYQQATGWHTRVPQVGE